VPRHSIKAFLRNSTGNRHFLRFSWTVATFQGGVLAALTLTQNQLNKALLVFLASTLSLVEDSSENKRSSKLEIDRPSDFKFHLAYEAYSRAWDEYVSDSVRAKLNELISVLANDENGYSDFYAQIQQYRKDVSSFRSGRTRIETQRKKDWQRTETRDGRNRRHK